MAGSKNEVQTMDAYNANFGADLFLSVQCNGSSNSAADSKKNYFYHSSGLALAECVQAKIGLNL